MKLALSAALLVIASVSSACLFSGDDKGKEVSPEEAQEIAQRALIVLEDLPSGWVETRAEEEDDSPELDLPPDCQSFVEQGNAPGSLASADSPDFRGPEDQEVSSGAEVFEDEGAARQAFEDIRDFLERCRQPLRDAFTKLMEESIREEIGDQPLPDLEVEFNLDPISFPSYGHETIAMRMTFAVTSEFGSFRFFLDILGMRSDRMTGGVTYQTFEEAPDADDEEHLMEAVEGRLEAAGEALE